MLALSQYRSSVCTAVRFCKRAITNQQTRPKLSVIVRICCNIAIPAEMFLPTHEYKKLKPQFDHFKIPTRLLGCTASHNIQHT